MINGVVLTENFSVNLLVCSSPAPNESALHHFFPIIIEKKLLSLLKQDPNSGNENVASASRLQLNKLKAPQINKFRELELKCDKK